MAGGTFSAYNKVRPGAYINVKSAKPAITDNNRGTVLLLNGVNYGWGNNGVITLTSDSDFKALIGVSVHDASAITISEALKNATYVKLVNVNTGTQASANDSSLPFNIKARYAGAKGNDITIDLVQSITNQSSVIVKTIFGTEVVDTQIIPVDHAEKIQDNDYVTFGVDTSKAQSISISGEKSVRLSGGNSTTATSDAQFNALSQALQTEQFQVATTAGFDEGDKIHGLLAQLVEDLRNNQGYKVTAVVPYSETEYDNEAVSVIENGVIYDDGTVVTPTIASAWFAGKSASVPFNKSLTYSIYEDVKAPYPALSQEQIIKSLNKGHIVFTARRDDSVVIEQDINTLTTFTDTKSSQFHKNRELRALDEIANHIENLFETGYIGQVTNNDDGRNLLKSSVTAYFKQLVTDGIIGDFDQADLTIAKGNADDTVVMTYSVTPVDSMEKLYNTITVTR